MVIATSRATVSVGATVSAGATVLPQTAWLARAHAAVLLAAAAVLSGAAAAVLSCAAAAVLPCAAAAVLSCAVLPCAAAAAAPVQEDFWRVEPVPTPPDVVMEVGSLEWIPGKDGGPDVLAVATRRGEIWMATGVEGDLARVTWRRFAEGLHEVLGLAWRDGWLYVTQRCEVSRLKDETGDGVADLFETVSDGWGINGDYHEYAFGSKFDAEGRIWVVLCLTGSGSSNSLFRGWCLRVGERGELIPTCSGIRSPGGIGADADGEVYYTDNQGPWNGTCSLKHLVPGDFMGSPTGNVWYERAPAMGPKPEEPRSGSRIAAEAARIPRLRPPAILFPYGTMGQSAAGVVCDTTRGGFGPFAGQLLVTDQSHSTVMRCALETVDGVRQGACFPMLAGLRSGTLVEQFSPRGMLFVGGTNRGWGSRGAGDFALERVTWTGRTPFEIRRMRLLPDGFDVEFTEPVDPRSAGDPASWAAKGFTYIYQSSYGSPVVDDEPCPVAAARPAADGRSVRLTVKNLRAGVIHEIKAAGVRSAAGLPLLHDTGWYTLNRLAR